MSQTPANPKTDGMFKSQLQEFCQRKSWPLPEYNTVRDGPLHGPHFKATVTVNGNVFESADGFKRAKDAQIEAAKLALAHFTSSASDGGGTAVGKSSPAPGIVGTSAVSINLEKSHLADEIKTHIVQEQVQDSEKISDIRCNMHDGDLHIYKNQLQSVVMKKGYDLPVYTSEREGPPHNSRFKSKVSFNGQVYESPRFFNTLKESEHAAAKVALSSLVPTESQDSIIDKSVFKNLLQELTQKSGMKLPIYSTTGSGASHMRTFVSTVLIDGETFYGEEAKTKKLAEMNVAELAYTCLTRRKLLGSSGCASISAPKSEPASNSRACNTFNIGATNQLDSPSKTISTQSEAGRCKSGDQEAPKQIPSGAVSMHVNAKDLLEVVPLSQSNGSSPITPSEVLQSSVLSNADMFPDSSSSPRNIVRVYPRTMCIDFPVGAVVQHTDDNWIAVRFPASQTGH